MANEGVALQILRNLRDSLYGSLITVINGGVKAPCISG